MTDPDLLGLVFDTGHYLYGSGSVDGERIQDGLNRFGERVQHVHFKDCQPRVATQARAEGWDYFTALRHGVFCELGLGSVPYAAVAEWLRNRGYRGWMSWSKMFFPVWAAPKRAPSVTGPILEASVCSTTGKVKPHACTFVEDWLDWCWTHWTTACRASHLTYHICRPGHGGRCIRGGGQAVCGALRYSFRYTRLPRDIGTSRYSGGGDLLIHRYPCSDHRGGGASW